MKTHYSYRTRAFILCQGNDGYEFPMLKRKFDDRALWQLPGGGMDGFCGDKPVVPLWNDVFQTQIQETREELGLDISRCRFAHVLRHTEVYHSGNPNHTLWLRKGIEADKIEVTYYFLACMLPKRPGVVLGEPEKFLEIAWPRIDHFYEDIHSPKWNQVTQFAPLAAGVEKAYANLDAQKIVHLM